MISLAQVLFFGVCLVFINGDKNSSPNFTGVWLENFVFICAAAATEAAW